MPVTITQPIYGTVTDNYAHISMPKRYEAAFKKCCQCTTAGRTHQSHDSVNVKRLTQGTPAHALHCQAGLASNRSLDRDWRRRPGRPRARWTDQLHNDTGSVPANLWRQTGHPTGPWWSDATARAGYVMTTTGSSIQHC